MGYAVLHGEGYECRGCGKTVDDVDLRDVVKPSQLIRVHINNSAPIGGSTQFEEFNVTERTWDEIKGVDEIWNDEVTVTRNEMGLHLQSGGKSGEVKKIETLETTEDGIPIHGTSTIVFRV